MASRKRIGTSKFQSGGNTPSALCSNLTKRAIPATDMMTNFMIIPVEKRTFRIKPIARGVLGTPDTLPQPGLCVVSPERPGMTLTRNDPRRRVGTGNSTRGGCFGYDCKEQEPRI